MTAKSVLLRPQGLRHRARAPTCPLATSLRKNQMACMAQLFQMTKNNKFLGERIFLNTKYNLYSANNWIHFIYKKYTH